MRPETVIRSWTPAPMGVEDTMLAAQALSCGLALVTHNRKQFARVEGLRVDDGF